MNGYDGEAALDVEWASAAAPAATIMLASCASTNTTDGVFMAIHHLVNSSNPPPIISVSYALCEADNGAGANAAFNQIYKPRPYGRYFGLRRFRRFRRRGLLARSRAGLVGRRGQWLGQHSLQRLGRRNGFP